MYLCYLTLAPLTTEHRRSLISIRGVKIQGIKEVTTAHLNQTATWSLAEHYQLFLPRILTCHHQSKDATETV